MDKSPRSLRRLPARSAKSAERTFSKVVTANDVGSPPAASPRAGRKTLKDSNRKEAVTKNASPPRRRSRSRSNARKRPEATKVVKEVNEKEVFAEKLSSRSKKPTPTPVTKIVSRLKEGIDKVRNSVSPEIEDVVRRSLSRFEEVTSEVVSNVVTRRTSSRLSRASSAINSITAVAPAATIQEEEIKELKSTNHTSAFKKDKSPVTQESDKISSVKIILQVLIGALVCLFVPVSHAFCNKDDCRLLSSKLSKVLDYKQYFDSYTWPIYSLSLLVLYIGCRITLNKSKRPQHLSVVGLLSVVVLLASIWTCHHYYGGLRVLKIAQLIGASVVHILVLLGYAGRSGSLTGHVRLENLVQLVSSLLMVLLNGHLLAVEYSRTTPNLAVIVLCWLQIQVAVDHLLLPPLILSLGPLELLWLSLRPFLLLLPQVYLSANNISLGTYAVIAIASVHVIGYAFYRYSSSLKVFFLQDPYSQRYSKSTICGDYSEGPWSLVRHPNLLGLLLCELSWISGAAPSLVAAALAPLSLLSVLFIAWSADHRLSRTYRAKIPSSLVPFLPL